MIHTCNKNKGFCPRFLSVSLSFPVQSQVPKPMMLRLLIGYIFHVVAFENVSQAWETVLNPYYFWWTRLKTISYSHFMSCDVKTKQKTFYRWCAGFRAQWSLVSDSGPCAKDREKQGGCLHLLCSCLRLKSSDRGFQYVSMFTSVKLLNWFS